MSRGARAFLWVILLLVPLAMSGGLWYLAGSARGAALLAGLLERTVPGLGIEGFEGTVLRGRIDTLRWQGAGETILLRELGWELERGCLARLALCAQRLSARGLDIDIAASAGDSRIDLPPLSLPVAIDITAASIDTLVLRAEARELLRLEAIRLAATLRGSRVELSSLHARREDLELQARGRLDIAGRLPLALQATIAHADWPPLSAAAEGDLDRLALNATLGGEWPLSLTGSVEPLAPGLPLALEVRAGAPLALPGPAASYGALVDARATITGTLRGLDAELQAGTQSPWIGANRLQASLRWSPDDGIALRSASLAGEAGRLEGTGQLALGESLAWQLGLQLQDACLPRWREAAGCRLGGSVVAAGTLAGPAPGLSARIDLAGEVNALPAAVAGRVAWDAKKTLELDDLRLRSAGNTLQLSGSAGESLALEARLAIEALGGTLPGASGRGHAELRIEGSRAEPQVDASLALSDLAWRGTVIEHLQGRLRGTRAAHTLAAAFRMADTAVALDCRGAGAATAGDWSGRCSRFDLKTREGLPDWQLEHSLQLDWRAAARRLSIDPFCLRSGDTTACSTGRLRASPEAIEGIALRADAVPVDLLPAWLPPGMSAQGTLAIVLDASRRGTGPLQLHARLSSPRLRIAPLAAGEEVPVELRDLTISLRREGETLRLAGNGRIGDEGRLEVGLEAAGAAPDSALSGRIALLGIDTGPVLRILPGSLEAAGRLGGEIRVAGSLASPALAGEIAIHGGRLAHEALPQPIDDFTLALRFAGADATFDGQLRTRAGTGEIDGALRWAGDDWSARLRLHAEDLLLEPRRGTRIHVAPDITVALDPALARISGQVRVPRADVDLAALPESAVGVSRDTVIVGRQGSEAGIDYTLAVDLLPGEQVHLRGFGADARLGGALRLLREPGGALEGEGEIRIREGRYNAYGQRLEVTEGSLVFNGPLTRPALRITAVRRIEDEPVTVGVQVRGNAKAPELKVFSRPTMPESRALHYLLTGRAPAAGKDNELAAGSALMQLGAAGAGKVTGKVLGKLGIRDFQVDSRKVEGGTEVQLSGYLTPDIYLRYGVSTFDRVNTLRVRYRLTPRFFVEAVSGVESAVDFLYSFSR